MRIFTKHAAIILLLIFIAVKGVFAGGFPLRPGRLVISPSASYFFANTTWSPSGERSSFTDNGKFTSFTTSLYAEYGLSRRFALVASLPYSVNKYQQTNYSNTSSGATDLETGLRYYLANIDFKYYFAIQGTLITPLYKDLNLGYGLTGAELKLSVAGSGHLFGQSDYFTLDDGIRQYYGTAGPFQDRYSGTFGVTLDKKFKEQISVSVSGFYSVSDDKAYNILNPVNNKNFSFTQASLSYGHIFSKHVSLFLSGGHFLVGRNTADGLTTSLAFIYRIDNK